MVATITKITIPTQNTKATSNHQASAPYHHQGSRASNSPLPATAWVNDLSLYRCRRRWICNIGCARVCIAQQSCGTHCHTRWEIVRFRIVSRADATPQHDQYSYLYHDGRWTDGSCMQHYKLSILHVRWEIKPRRSYTLLELRNACCTTDMHALASCEGLWEYLNDQDRNYSTFFIVTSPSPSPLMSGSLSPHD